MKRKAIAIVTLSLLIGFFSTYIIIQGLHNGTQMENINRMFTEDEEINFEDLYYYHESINQSSRAMSMSAWIIIALTLINCIVGYYLFLKLKQKITVELK